MAGNYRLIQGRVRSDFFRVNSKSCAVAAKDAISRILQHWLLGRDRSDLMTKLGFCARAGDTGPRRPGPGTIQGIVPAADGSASREPLKRRFMRHRLSFGHSR